MLMGAGLNATAINGVIGDRVLHIPGSAVVTLQSVTIARGSADNGGGIYNSGTLTVLGTRLYQNAASSTGGGIYNCCLSNSAVTLSHSRISANSAGVYGGGIVNHYGTLTVSHSTVSANAAYLDGGGIFNHNQGTLIVSHSKIAGNAAPYNGGIANYTGGVTVSHTTISDNRATCCYGGGLFNSCCSSDSTVKISHSTISGNSAAGSGGGIFNDGTLTLSNSTVSGNSASYGGGIYNYGSAAPPTLRVSNSTIAGNSASYGGGFYKYTGVAIFKGSILGANTASSSPDCAGTVASEGYNLVGDNSGCTFNEATGDLIGTQDDPIDPLLGPLQDNGGPTWTRALLEESPAIDTGSPDHCPPKDQRGYPRPVDGDADGVAICDIGSVEYRSMPEQRGR